MHGMKIRLQVPPSSASMVQFSLMPHLLFTCFDRMGASCSTAALGTERRKRAAQRLAGNHHEASERLAQLQDQKDRG